MYQRWQLMSKIQVILQAHHRKPTDNIVIICYVANNLFIWYQRRQHTSHFASTSPLKHQITLILYVTQLITCLFVRTASRDRQPPTTKNKTRPHDIPNGKRRFDLAKASVLLFFHGLGASSSTAALGLLGAFSSEAWLRGLPLRRFGT
ncbi:hypothetical protein F8M41_006597 [Gigaspora margarita]|uniref:Uncharacterized protein n=1 Tax=Gigaspora margarita TaxID=4874 RepID=A0A8H4ERA4_GIGMA|nr:hypothetical protein F8M41_006597 [Gigaspora margarita]